jgi:hypothetical protein
MIILYYKHVEMLSVYLVGGSTVNEGNVYAFNPDTEIFGPICEDTWDKLDVITDQNLFSPSERGRY